MLKQFRILLAPLALLAIASCATAQTVTLAPYGREVVALPVTGAQPPVGGEGLLQKDARFGTIVRNVTQPTLTAYLPDPKIATGAAVIVAPGGGFHMLSIENEGTAVAEWLNSIGVAAFVLRYRLIETDDGFGMTLMRRLVNRKELDMAVAPVRPLVTADGEAAMRAVRANARRWHVEADRVGMVGFSAGGAVTVWTMQQGNAATRPDFAAAIYPGLLPDPIIAPAKAPPLFVAVAKDDGLASGDSARLAKAWTDAGAKAELIVYPSGGHGFGMAPTGKPTDAWLAAFRNWLDQQGALKK